MLFHKAPIFLRKIFLSRKNFILVKFFLRKYVFLSISFQGNLLVIGGFNFNELSLDIYSNVLNGTWVYANLSISSAFLRD